MSATDFSPLSSGPAIGPRPAERFRSRDLKPPRGLYLPRGPLSNVRFGGETPQNRGHTAAQKLGLAFEQRVHDVLEAIYEIDYRRAPSVLFEDRSGLHRAIPDGLLKIGPDLVIVEVKLSHCERAWWQLTRLYRPLLRTLVVPGTRVRCVEICRSYDPAISFPEPHTVVTSLHKLPVDTVGVLQWKI